MISNTKSFDSRPIAVKVNKTMPSTTNSASNPVGNKTRPKF